MRSFLLTAALAAFGCAPCFADTVFVLNNAVFTNGATASGSITLNTATGVVSGANITSSVGGTQYNFNIVSGQQNGFDKNFPQATFNALADGSGNLFVFNIPTPNLIAYGGGNVCSTTTACDGFVSGIRLNSGSNYALQTGALAQSPEPSSLMLIGTGALSLAGLVRRRYAARNA